MDQLAMEIAKQVPALVALVWLVWSGLRTLKEMTKDRQQSDAIRDEALQKLGDNCHTFQREIAAKTERVFDRVAIALENSAKTIGEGNTVLERVDETLDRIEKIVEGKFSPNVQSGARRAPRTGLQTGASTSENNSR